jgi:hypothetical protein
VPFKIVNKKDWIGPGTYIGRGSVWGNPASHIPLEKTKATVQVATREEAVEYYREYAREQWEENEFFRLCMTSLAQAHLRGELIVLACYCAPERCHGVIIAEFATGLVELGIVTLEDSMDNPFD